MYHIYKVGLENLFLNRSLFLLSLFNNNIEMFMISLCLTSITIFPKF